MQIKIKNKWEWRIFYSNKENPWKNEILRRIEEILLEIKSKKQIDYYILFENSDVGLKLRDYKQKNLLELKVRSNKIGNTENWRKYLSKEFKSLKNLNSRTLIFELKKELSNQKSNQKNNELYIDLLKNLIENLQIEKKKEKKLNIVIIEKDRKQFRAIFDDDNKNWNLSKEWSNNPNVVVIESSDLWIGKERKEVVSICVEGQNIQYISKFVEDFVLKNKGDIMGYPEFLKTFFNG